MRMKFAVPVLGLALVAACGNQEAADPADALDASAVATTPAPAAAEAPTDAHALDQTLIPSAQNAELKALLEEGRPIFAGHLDMAKQIQSAPAGP